MSQSIFQADLSRFECWLDENSELLAKIAVGLSHDIVDSAGNSATALDSMQISEKVMALCFASRASKQRGW